MNPVSKFMAPTQKKVPMMLHTIPPMKPSTVLLGLNAINLVFPKVIPAKKAQASLMTT